MSRPVICFTSRVLLIILDHPLFRRQGAGYAPDCFTQQSRMIVSQVPMMIDDIRERDMAVYSSLEGETKNQSSRTSFRLVDARLPVVAGCAACH